MKKSLKALFMASMLPYQQQILTGDRYLSDTLSANG